MKPRDYVLAQIQHHETHPVPYSLAFDDGTDTILDDYYGSPAWRERLTAYMVNVGGVDTIQHEQVDDIHERDAFGGLWRLDRRPWHLERPPLQEPSFDNYDFPTPDRFLNTTLKQ